MFIAVQAFGDVQTFGDVAEIMFQHDKNRLEQTRSKMREDSISSKP